MLMILLHETQDHLEEAIRQLQTERMEEQQVASSHVRFLVAALLHLEEMLKMATGGEVADIKRKICQWQSALEPAIAHERCLYTMDLNFELSLNSLKSRLRSVNHCIAHQTRLSLCDIEAFVVLGHA
jgi:hypothetical protein